MRIAVLYQQTLIDNPCKQTVSGVHLFIRVPHQHRYAVASYPNTVLLPPSTLHNLVEMPGKGITCPCISLIRWNKLREPGKAARKCPRPTLIGNCFPASANQRARLVARKTALSFYSHGITMVSGSSLLSQMRIIASLRLQFGNDETRREYRGKLVKRGVAVQKGAHTYK